MTLEQLEEQLPNGLHDAKIRTLTHDYVAGIVTLDAEILTGLPDDPAPICDSYRNVKISFADVLLCHIDQPENERIIGVKGSIWFTYSRMEPGVLLPKLTGRIHEAALSYTLYILDWVSSIHIIAKDVEFSWAEVAAATSIILVLQN